MNSSGVKNGKNQHSARGKYYLGVDGGGTKTLAIIIDSGKKVVAEGMSGASNPVRIGIEKAVANISEAVSIASDRLSIVPERLAAGTFGLAGVRREDLRQRLTERLGETLKMTSISVVTDAEIALYGSVKDGPGLVVIAGSGSICLGKNAAGKTFSAGGWGPLAGDEGGAAGIAREALRAIARASDTRGASTLLTKYAMQYFRAAKPDDLVLAIYAPQVDNLKIAGFAKCVAGAAQEGDSIAIEIMKNAGKELGVAAVAVIKNLKLQNETFPIGKVGSVFNAKSLITDELMKTVKKIAPRACLIEPELSPAEAAANLSLNRFVKSNSAIRI